MVLIVQPMNSTGSTHFTAWKALNIPEDARDCIASQAELLKALSHEFDVESAFSSDSEEGAFDYKHLSDSDLEQLKRAFEKSKRILAVDAKLRSMPELTVADSGSLGGAEIEQENSPLPSLTHQNCVFRIESSTLDALSDISSLSNVEESKCQKSDVCQKLRALDGFGLDGSAPSDSKIQEGENQQSDVFQKLKALDFDFDGSAPSAGTSMQRQDCVYNL